MKHLRRFLIMTLVILTLTGLCACAITVPDPVDISSADEAAAMGFQKGDHVSELLVGEYAFFGVEIKIDYEYEVKWHSSDPKIATVDSNGRVDAISPGKAVITASAKKASIDYELTVKKGKGATYNTSTAITGNQSTVNQNLKSENAATPYAILVNLKSHCATVYTYNAYGIYNVAVRSMIFASGSGTSTPEDSYNINAKATWYHSDEGTYHQYSSRFGDDFRFCSTPYERQSADTLIAEEYNKLGTSATKGDIWLSVADAKWIYENCGEKTLVKVTNSDGGDPLGVPEAMKLTDKSVSLNWDPTDDSKDNPYRKKLPTFSGLEKKYVLVGGTFDAYEGVVAYDICGNPSTENIVVDGSVPCTREGNYIISYYYTDAMGRTARVDRHITVLYSEEYATIPTEPATGN